MMAVRNGRIKAKTKREEAAVQRSGDLVPAGDFRGHVRASSATEIVVRID